MLLLHVNRIVSFIIYFFCERLEKTNTGTDNLNYNKDISDHTLFRHYKLIVRHKEYKDFIQ